MSVNQPTLAERSVPHKWPKAEAVVNVFSICLVYMQHGDFSLVINVCSTITLPLKSFNSTLASQRETPCTFMAERDSSTASPPQETWTCIVKRDAATGRKTLRVHWVGASYNCQQIQLGFVLVGVLMWNSILTVTYWWYTEVLTFQFWYLGPL